MECVKVENENLSHNATNKSHNAQNKISCSLEIYNRAFIVLDWMSTTCRLSIKTSIYLFGKFSFIYRITK